VGEDAYVLRSASRPKELVEYLQNVVKPKKPDEGDREPFEVLVDTLSGVVKSHLTTHGKEYITQDYVEKLDDTLTHGVPIDLRSEEEREVVENWKVRNIAESSTEKHKK
jgi:hypothetical protein